jgi:hypothetical protein
MCANVNASLGLDILLYSEIQECSQSIKKIYVTFLEKNQYIDRQLPRNFQLLLFY